MKTGAGLSRFTPFRRQPSGSPIRHSTVRFRSLLEQLQDLACALIVERKRLGSELLLNLHSQKLGTHLAQVGIGQIANPTVEQIDRLRRAVLCLLQGVEGVAKRLTDGTGLAQGGVE